MISLHSKFQLPVSRNSTVIIRSENKENIYMADVFSVVKDIIPTKDECFSRYITIVGPVPVAARSKA